MRKHWHKIYVAETVKEVISFLQSSGIQVDYNPKPEDPEDANGYIEQDSGTISSCARWRSSNKKPNLIEPAPKESMACLELISTATIFEKIKFAVAHNLNIIQDCQNC